MRLPQDHRILKDPSENLEARDQVLPTPADELVYDPRPLGFEDAKPDLRSLALAYPQVAGKVSDTQAKRLAALQQAARELRDDAEFKLPMG